ncbi:glycosyltransferase [Brachybacterium sp. J144]|uniref:glycosyltransferase n=1 Tax=Brachybacterium sp. J144 TaxID=3116487 RepID=UPI002E773BDE|nr:glycosyltransferase [Brachybacterium sp. J144]MEE1650733.1 glycosyltransferase [Brachybacterium sp. J144]
MTFDDETRTDAEIELLRANEAATDPIAAFRSRESYRQQAEDLRSQLKAARDALADAEKAARWQKKKRAEAETALKTAEAAASRAEKADAAARRRIEVVEASRDRYKDEVQRLKDDLVRVRGSRTFKVGKAVLSPVQVFRSSGSEKVTASPAGTENPTIEEPAPTEAATPAPAKTPAPVSSSTAATPSSAGSPRPAADGSEWESHLPVGQRDLDTLRREFEIHPSPVTLYRVINRTWFGHGMIEEPAALAIAHPELVEQLGAKEKGIIERVLGDDRLRREGVTVPPRSSGAVFLPEPSRVMYCVHSTPVFNSNGYSTRTRGVAKGLQHSGADVRVVARAGYPWDHKADRPKPSQRRVVEELDGVSYVHMPGSGLGTVPMDHYLIEAADAFTREALLQRPELIQSASNYRTALPALIAARRVGVPFVYEVRGFWELSQVASKPEFEDSEQYRTIADLETLVAREADHVLAITRQVQEDLIARGIPAERITVAPNAVDTDEFVPLPRDARYAEAKGIRTDVPVIGFAGSMVAYEGLETLVRASAELTERGTEHQVVIAGSGAEEKTLVSLRDELGAAAVHFVGRLPMDEMPRLLSTFDIMPIPRLSLPVTEMVSPLKPLEAFASMKAVLLSDVAPHLDLAGPEQARARLFRAGHVTSLADALDELIADADRCRDLGRTARLWTLDDRTWNAVTAEMRLAHQDVLRHGDESASAGRTFDTFTVGLIADEFTTSTLSASMRIVPLDRSRWREQLDAEGLDLVLVESAWEGNGGQWHRGVGAYEPEEHRDIRELLAHARERGITTAFWNKEDPIHIRRFRATAALCDHVFTTDAAMIPTYLSTPGAVTRTASAMPFYAQPLIHNPLPAERPYRHTVAYAGTYYGDRYKERSKELYRMLETSSAFGLTIYDRQASNPDSPYRFPPEFAHHSEGALPYDEVIDSYKTHLAHLNGNSVMDSPSMFSRRVVEIAACGGIALSGPGRGVEETFQGMIPVSKDASLWRALLHAWSTDPVARVHEAWRQMRAVHRSHTVQSALTVLLRTTGLAVDAAPREGYAAVLTERSSELVASLLAQSQRPAEVFVPGGPSEVTAPLTAARITVRDSSEAGSPAAAWIGIVDEPLPRTWFEDLLLAPRFGTWNRIDAEIADGSAEGRTLATLGALDGSVHGLVRSERAAAHPTVEAALRAHHDSAVRLLVVGPRETPAEAVADAEMTTTVPRRVLIAGHDLKFAGALIEELEHSGHTVLIDQWDNHTKHDEDRSRELLAQADVVFCEWGLGNAVWYSKHLGTHQRLVVRVHLQELDRPFLRRITHKNVDAFVFVGELIRRAAVESHGVPASRSHVVPNFVDVEGLTLPKDEDARFHLGFVGMVPQRKRLDLAVALLERLLEQDSRFRLFVKGKRPEDYPWMADRPEEMAYYDALSAQIERVNSRFPDAVQFDGHGANMDQWYRKIGVALSVSDFESFHFTVADGAASGALPASLAWAGSDLLYPREWLSGTVEDMATSILTRLDQSRDEADVIASTYSEQVVLPRLVELVAPARP